MLFREPDMTFRLFFCAGGKENNGKDDADDTHQNGEGPMFRRLRMKR